MKTLLITLSIISLMSCSIYSLKQNEIRKLEDKDKIKYSIGTVIEYSKYDSNKYIFLNLEDLYRLIAELKKDHSEVTDKEILVISKSDEIILTVFKDKSRYE